jgi:hypothetical protein
MKTVIALLACLVALSGCGDNNGIDPSNTTIINENAATIIDETENSAAIVDPETAESGANTI